MHHAPGALEVDSLTKRYGTQVALDGMSFSVSPGEVFGFVGSNGAGKTTTMRIAGRLRGDPPGGGAVGRASEVHRKPPRLAVIYP
ncbi:ATP-binding cassette domain-containing protein, partial [Streptomyces mirabilis]|uniref:ATP-binding cassette domain-containing protein n=1 Tax=Streptomyces mirabilis TaxID=68239 RepID=UPI00369D5FD4